jgi:invasion protein IalB
MSDHEFRKREVSVFRNTFLAVTLTMSALATQVAAQEEAVVKATHGDWEVRCVEASNDCVMTQQVKGDADNTLFVVELVRLEGNPNGVAGMRVRAPLGVLLTRGLQVRIDSGEPVQAPFVFCVQDVCVAEIVLREQDLNLFRRGAVATLTVVAVQAPDAPQQGDMSLIGFTKSFEELG